MLGFFTVKNCVEKGCGEFFYRYHEERSLSCLFQHAALCTLAWEIARSYLCSVNCLHFLTSLRVARYRGRWGLSGCVLPNTRAQNRREELWASYQYSTPSPHFTTIYLSNEENEKKTESCLNPNTNVRYARTEVPVCAADLEKVNLSQI